MRILEGIGSTKRKEFDPQGRYFSVTPLVDMDSLGMEYLGILLEVNGSGNIDKIESIADEHPYTQYRVRCFGKYNGIFMQFRYPIGSRELIVEMLDKLKKKKVISNFIILPFKESSPILTTMSIRGWNPTDMGWKFDWDRWFKKKLKARKKTESPKIKGQVLEWLTKKDVYIIQEVMGGARRKNLEIIDSLKKKGVEITPQTFSRRYKMIQKECFNGYWTNFDSTIFDIYTTVIIFGEGDKIYLNELAARLEQHPIPFLSYLRVFEKHMLWYLRIQSAHLSRIMSKLHENLDEMSICIADYSTSRRYYIWPEAFDDESKAWKVSRRFMLDDVLRILG